jgi:hypothetical protein
LKTEYFIGDDYTANGSDICGLATLWIDLVGSDTVNAFIEVLLKRSGTTPVVLSVLSAICVHSAGRFEPSVAKLDESFHEQLPNAESSDEDEVEEVDEEKSASRASDAFLGLNSIVAALHDLH